MKSRVRVRDRTREMGREKKYKAWAMNALGGV